MKKVTVSFDKEPFWSKPAGSEVAAISNRIGNSTKAINAKELRTFAEKVAIDGCTFCPATFKDGKRSKENFEQQQFFALDFDNKDSAKKITLEEVKIRADHYIYRFYLPMTLSPVRTMISFVWYF